jgi:hypothetical protein
LTIDQLPNCKRPNLPTTSVYQEAPLAKRTSNHQKKDFIHIITCYPNHLAS